MLGRHNMTEASTVSGEQLRKSVPGMAHFAGTGPAGLTCGDCFFWQAIPRSPRQHCAKYRELVRKGPLQAIPHNTPSCRHFEPRSLTGKGSRRKS
jgi:hypothetical protein